MDADERAIRVLQAAWMEASLQGDLPRVLSLMADDVVFLTPGRAPFGKDEFAATFRSGQGQAQIRPTSDLEEIVVCGDVAHTRTRLAIEIEPAAGEIKRMAGYALTIFRRQADGNWLLSRDANLLMPAPAKP